MGRHIRATRWILLTICTIQLVSTAQRQVLDFLGYMWLPIAANFIHILCTIIGFFGAYQWRLGYIAVYLASMILCVVWNVFVICFYLEVGFLNRDDGFLNLSTGSRSWLEANGLGCSAKYNESFAGEEAWKKPFWVHGCLVQYYYIECAQAAVQIFMAVVGFIIGCYIIWVIRQKYDGFPPRRKGIVGGLPYSIEFQRHPVAHENAYQRPMTPRKVKRRSIRSTRNLGTLPPRQAHGAVRQAYYQNPVTRLIALQPLNAVVDNSTNQDDCFVRNPSRTPYQTSGHLNLGYQSSGHLSHHSRRPSPIYMNDSETVI